MRMTWRRSGAGHALRRQYTNFCTAVYATVLEGDVSEAKREEPVEFWTKKTEEAVQDDLD